MDPVTRYQVDLGNLALSAAALLDPVLFARIAPDLERWADMADVTRPQLRLVPTAEEPGDPLVP
jgi:hypothetical protein